MKWNNIYQAHQVEVYYEHKTVRWLKHKTTKKIIFEVCALINNEFNFKADFCLSRLFEI